MAQSNPPPPDPEWGGHTLAVEMHAGTQPPLWVTGKADATEPTLLRLLDERSVVVRNELESAVEGAKRLEFPSLHPITKLIEADGAIGLESPYIAGIMLTA